MARHLPLRGARQPPEEPRAPEQGGRRRGRGQRQRLADAITPRLAEAGAPPGAAGARSFPGAGAARTPEAALRGRGGAGRGRGGGCEAASSTDPHHPGQRHRGRLRERQPDAQVEGLHAVEHTAPEEAPGGRRGAAGVAAVAATASRLAAGGARAAGHTTQVGADDARGHPDPGRWAHTQDHEAGGHRWPGPAPAPGGRDEVQGLPAAQPPQELVRPAVHGGPRRRLRGAGGGVRGRRPAASAATRRKQGRRGQRTGCVVLEVREEGARRPEHQDLRPERPDATAAQPFRVAAPRGRVPPDVAEGGGLLTARVGIPRPRRSTSRPRVLRSLCMLCTVSCLDIGPCCAGFPQGWRTVGRLSGGRSFLGAATLPWCLPANFGEGRLGGAGRSPES
mmetsp:Transcript_87231/g.247312  ORF Transcript_87231/g.247312 Transcript_87231/m.247312 type:complete len:393 (+) Transcript_87231:2392-3570(+)